MPLTGSSATTQDGPKSLNQAQAISNPLASCHLLSGFLDTSSKSNVPSPYDLTSVKL